MSFSWSKRIFCYVIFNIQMNASGLSPCLYTLFLCFYGGGGTTVMAFGPWPCSTLHSQVEGTDSSASTHEPPTSIEIMGKWNNWGTAGRTIPAIVCRSFQFLGWISVGRPTPKVIPVIYGTEDICAISLIVSLTGPLSQKVQDQSSKRWKYQLLKFSGSWKTKDSGGLPSNLTEE